MNAEPRLCLRDFVPTPKDLLHLVNLVGLSLFVGFGFTAGAMFALKLFL